jgi:hypothetical protein
MFYSLNGDNCFNLVGTLSDGNVFDIRILEILVDIQNSRGILYPV